MSERQMYLDMQRERDEARAARDGLARAIEKHRVQTKQREAGRRWSQVALNEELWANVDEEASRERWAATRRTLSPSTSQVPPKDE